MTNDETMARIEAALDDYAEACVQEFRSSEVADVRKAVEAKTAALAMIREALPKPDAEHEAKVEAWVRRIPGSITEGWRLTIDDMAEASRLMRARPATERDKAAAELLRAADSVASWLAGINVYEGEEDGSFDAGKANQHENDMVDGLGNAIEAAKRAGIGQ